MISSNNERGFIPDLSSLTLNIIFDDWRAAMYVGSKCSINRNNIRLVQSWRFNVYCGGEHSRSLGFICIVYHCVLRHQSEHNTRSIGRLLLAKHTIQSQTDSQSWQLPKWLVQLLIKHYWPYRRDKKVKQLQLELTKDIHVSQFEFIVMNCIDKQNTPNWPLWTLQVLNFTKTPGFATSC